MFFSERKRIAELAEREAAGEALWNLNMPGPAREKLVILFQGFLNDYVGTIDDYDRIHSAVTSSRGVRALRGISQHKEDLEVALRNAEIDVVADIIEAACALVMKRYDAEGFAEFEQSVNDILDSYRIAVEVVAGQVVEFESREMHQSVVVPALLLFGGNEKFALAESAYQNALSEVATDSGAADAITDAGTCLQEVLLSLGCKGNALGPLMKDARNKGLLGSADSKLSSGVGDLIDWVSSDRSSNGDAHNARPALREDAWLAIHVVGSLALRLASGKPRS